MFTEDLISLAAAIDRVAAVHRSAAETALGEAGVPTSLAGVLWLLERAPADPSMRDVAHHLRCDPSYVTLLAGQLEKAGLAERATADDDARKRVLRLTPEGSTAARKMLTAVADASPLGTLSAEDRGTLTRALNLVESDDR